MMKVIEDRMQEFLLDFSNDILNAFYKNPNYKILHGYAHNRRCYIFCSSNGLYYPNKYSVFEDIIVNNDRYEFQFVAKMLLPFAEKIILIRDIRKQFYVYGINENLNTIDKVAEFLRSETEGYDVITAGGSAGGYMAIILGYLLQAKSVYTTSAPVNLYTFSDVIDTYSSLIENKADAARNKYYNLIPFLKNCTIPVFYFYASECEMDIEQAKQINILNTIYIYSIKGSSHGTGFTPRAWCSMLNLSKEEMLALNDGVARLPAELNSLILENATVEIKDEKLLLNTRTVQKLHSIEVIKSINKPKIIYGAGKYGSKLFDSIKLFAEVKITDSDNDKKLSFGDYFIDSDFLMTKSVKNSCIVLIAVKNNIAVNEIIRKLENGGWKADNIFWVDSLFL